MSVYLFFHYIRSIVYNVWQVIFKFFFNSGSMYIFRFHEGVICQFNKETGKFL